MAGIILLAAGTGSRFIAAGGKGNKLNAPLQKTAGNAVTVFEATLRQARASRLPVHVVTRPENRPVQECCLREGIPFTLISSTGTGGSIAAGVRDTADWDGWLIHLADMPFVTPEVFAAVADALSQETIVRPYWQNEPGHPVGFALPMREKLLLLRGDNGARELFRSHAWVRLDFNNPAVTTDIDFPEQLSSSLLIPDGKQYAAS